MKSIVEENFD
jgi:hypothetical protein